MRKIKYPLIISDFDGTLVRADGTISENNKKAIFEYTKNGGHFAISTGRLHYGILPRAKELGLDGVVSCGQGSVIVDIQSGKAVLDGALSYETTLKACLEMEKLDLHIHLYTFDGYYANKDNEVLKWYESTVQFKANLVTDKPLSKLVEEKKLRAYKLLAIVPPSDAQEIMSKLSKAHYDGAGITRSADCLVEIVNAKYSKGTAITFLANRYGIPLEKTVGVGDQMNDIPMIQTAGVGIAVNNADDGLKSVADVVCAYTNEQDAIAHIIEEYGYTEE